MTDLPRHLVTTDWLANNLGAPDLKVIDATYFLPNLNRDALSEHRQRRLPGALFFDVDGIKDTSNPLPHMLPSPEVFAAAVGRLGIRNNDRIVAYDALGLMSAARAWWMFRIFGHDRVAVLDGGLPKWRAEARPIETGQAQAEPTTFAATFRPELVVDIAAVTERLASAPGQVVDARPAGRFTGVDPEPRAGLRSGHMPGAANVPYGSVTANGTFLPPGEILERFRTVGVDPDQPIITSCGSGITACLLALGLALSGREQVAIYDGSWAEWGSHDDTAVVAGP